MKLYKIKEMLHDLMDKPILSGIVITICFMVSVKCWPNFPDEYEVENICLLGAFILFWIGLFVLYRKEFRDEIPSAPSIKTILFGLRFTAPTIIIGIVVLLAGIVALMTKDSSFFTPIVLAKCFMEALEAGVVEEIVLRGVFTGNMMRVNHSKKDMLKNALIPSAVFGIIHLLNITSGAGVISTIGQVMTAFAAGVMYSAVFFRTGTIIPGIIAHTFGDFASMITLTAQQGGENFGLLVDSGSVVKQLLSSAIGCALILSFGLYVMRKSKQPLIADIFDLDDGETPTIEGEEITV
ncbi:MAG: CPBP family intramembrane metalloprotease [Erysipelotrichaceae bacterium]|nr:CPBP family intramembrane metalloprotease [Erysipelotrichaceae bacterium]